MLHFKLYSIKSLTFEKENVVMEIPKSLAVGNYAVRCLFTSYDHLSEKCRLFFPRPKKATTDVPVVLEPVVEVTEEMVGSFFTIL